MQFFKKTGQDVQQVMINFVNNDQLISFIVRDAFNTAFTCGVSVHLENGLRSGCLMGLVVFGSYLILRLVLRWLKSFILRTIQGNIHFA